MAMITDTRSIGKISACIVLQPLTSFVEDRCTFVPSASQSVVTRNARKGAKLVEKSIFLPITTRRLSGIEVSLLLKSDISDINSGLEWWEEIQWEVVARRAMTGWRTGRHIESLLDLALGSLPASFTFPVIDCPHMCVCRQQFWTDCLVQVLQYRFEASMATCMQSLDFAAENLSHLNLKEHVPLVDRPTQLVCIWIFICWVGGGNPCGVADFCIGDSCCNKKHTGFVFISKYPFYVYFVHETAKNGAKNR